MREGVVAGLEFEQVGVLVGRRRSGGVDVLGWHDDNLDSWLSKRWSKRRRLSAGRCLLLPVDDRRSAKAALSSGDVVWALGSRVVNCSELELCRPMSHCVLVWPNQLGVLEIKEF
eukprot:scaffold302574_cov119-Cyclotella_meneghiniana.AAC.2